MPPVIFISYSHDSDQHREQVLGLSERLRQDGFDTQLDRYVNGTPPKGWPRWMLDRLDEAAFVLVVCTETYYRRFRGHEQPDRGKGVDWEGALITQEIYDARSHTLKFVPILFDSAQADFIPEPLRGLTHYTLNSDASYRELCDFLDGVAGVEPGRLGTRTTKTRRQATPLTFDPGTLSAASPATRIAPSRLPAGAEVLIGRDAELGILDRALLDAGTHVVEFVAWGGVGKSALTVDWMTRLAGKNWAEIERYFDWSFYSQGTRDQSAVSADLFIAAALAFFGDPDPQAGSPADRGNRLAELIARQPTLLILDGLEPLQYGTGPLKGQLKDPALLTLLKRLAQLPTTLARSASKGSPAGAAGLCVVTTREELADLKPYHGTTVAGRTLESLTESAGAELLYRSGATCRGAARITADDAELRAASREVDGHALTLSLLGGYLRQAHQGDIDRRDRVRFERADDLIQGGHAFRVIGAYERWLLEDGQTARQADGENAQRMVAILRLLGLFDRPASGDCLAALRREPAIAGLTDRLVGLDEEDWNIAVASLVELDLISRGASTLDAHPIVREYFAVQLRGGGERRTGILARLRRWTDKIVHPTGSHAWTEGHRRLYEHLCETTSHRPGGLDGLQPLYQAVAHGCLAGLHQQACEDVYRDRILRGTGNDGFYSSKKLGAIGADLGAVACFFLAPWRRLSPNLSPAYQAWLLNAAAYRLRALGRLSEAVEPMRAGLDMAVEQKDWKQAAIGAGNLSELELTLGRVSAAMTAGEQSVAFADRSQDAFWRMGTRTTHADALHQAGRGEQSLALFREAEGLQAEHQPQYPRLYSLRGFQYCDLLLADAERAAWQLFVVPPSGGKERPPKGGTTNALEACEHVTERAHEMLSMEEEGWLLDIALDHLTLGRAVLYGAIVSQSAISDQESQIATHIAAAVDGLRESGNMDDLPRGLLTRAWQRRVSGDGAGSRADLDEAWEIAERGPMPLYQADILLSRVRLFGRVKSEGGRVKEDAKYPWGSPRDNLANARRLIEKHGYHRRDAELEDAEAAFLSRRDLGN